MTMIEVSRRGLIGMLAAGVAASIVRPGLLMPIKPALQTRFDVWEYWSDVPSIDLWKRLIREAEDKFFAPMVSDLMMLDALMEPTEGMMQAGARSCADERANPDEPSARACFDAMIRAAQEGK